MNGFDIKIQNGFPMKNGKNVHILLKNYLY